MSYQYITDRDSPNCNPGRPGGTPTHIVIHWWGLPEWGQTFQNVIDFLCRPEGNSSAHYVAEAGRVACIVSPDDRAWHAPGGNMRGIGIECNPRMSEGDIATVAELIRDIRAVYGDLPLHPHSDFVSTQCPGVWRDNLGMGELDRRARGIRPNPTSPPAPHNPSNNTEEDENMSKNACVYYTDSNKTSRYLLHNPGSGWYHEFGGGTGQGPMSGDYVNPIAAAYGTGSFASVTESHYRVIKAACERLLAAVAGEHSE